MYVPGKGVRVPALLYGQVKVMNTMEAERCTFFGPLPLVYIPTVADRRRPSPIVVDRRRSSPTVAETRR